MSGLLVGCGETSFVGRKYDNFTAYYNKFYNAENAFDDAVEALRQDQRPVDRSTYISVYYVPEEGGDKSTFEEVIQKSADILREHPNSKWVDDALLLIGKSYFYQRNYVGASQKFREVIAMSGEREGEARFWLSRTLAATGRASDAQKALQNAFSEGAFGSWTAQMRLVQGGLLAGQEQWRKAASALEEGLAGDLPDRAGARGAYLLGQIYETLDEASDARKAYGRVLEYDPQYELEFAARLSEIELQGRYGSASRALERLEDLEDDDKNFEMRGEMAVVRAKIYRSEGKFDRARQTLKRLLYGKDGVSGQARGALHYELATLYRDAYDDFSRAAAHFDTASTALNQGRRRSEDVRSVPGAPSDAQAKSEQYQRLAERAREVARLDSLLRLGRMSDEEFQTFVATLRKQRRAEQERQREAAEAARRSQQFRGGAQTLAAKRRGAAAANTQSSEAGFLFHQDPARVQEGRRQFEQTWGDRPRVDNWRRRSAIRSQQTASGGATNAPNATPAQQAGTPGAGGETSGTRIDLSAIPRDSASQVEMEAEQAVARYEFANSLFLAAGRPDSAATWYRRILSESPEHAVARRALYALAEAQWAQGDTTGARDTYQRLVNEYPTSTLATRAQERLDRKGAPAGEDEDARADSAYAEAYRFWEEKDLGPALKRMLTVAETYPETSVGPRALLASGVIYWTMVQNGEASPKSFQQDLRSIVGSDTTDTTRVTASGDSSMIQRTGALGDSTRGAPREREAVRDEQPDSLRRATADTSALPVSDSTVATDTTSTGAATRPSEEDSVSTDTSRTETLAPLKRLLTHLTKQYPESPQGARAQSMLALIQEKTAGSDTTRSDTARTERMPEDSVATASSNRNAAPSSVEPTVANGESTASDSAGSTTKGEKDGVLPAPGAPAAREPDDARTQGTIWAVRIRAYSDSVEANRRRREISSQVSEWSVEVVPVEAGDQTRHHVVVGTFRRRAEAEEVRKELEARLNTELEVWRRPEQDADVE